MRLTRKPVLSPQKLKIPSRMSPRKRWNWFWRGRMAFHPRLGFAQSNFWSSFQLSNHINTPLFTRKNVHNFLSTQSLDFRVLKHYWWSSALAFTLIELNIALGGADELYIVFGGIVAILDGLVLKLFGSAKTCPTETPRSFHTPSSLPISCSERSLFSKLLSATILMNRFHFCVFSDIMDFRQIFTHAYHVFDESIDIEFEQHKEKGDSSLHD